MIEYEQFPADGKFITILLLIGARLCYLLSQIPMALVTILVAVANIPLVVCGELEKRVDLRVKHARLKERDRKLLAKQERAVSAFSRALDKNL